MMVSWVVWVVVVCAVRGEVVGAPWPVGRGPSSLRAWLQLRPLCAGGVQRGVHVPHMRERLSVCCAGVCGAEL